MSNLAHIATVLAHSDRKLARFVLCATLAATLAACAQEPPAAPVAPVKVQIVTSDYCQIMCRINPVTCKQPFSVNDHALTIERARRANRVVEQKNCASPKRTS